MASSDADDFTTRRATCRDEPFLREMLAIAMHWRDPEPPRTDDGVLPPEVSRYADGFGRPGDHGIIAACGSSSAGAAWCRLFGATNGGYGYVADDVPELSVAVLSQHRRSGVGSELIGRLIADISGYFDAISLSVEPDNPALLLYERLGFAKVSEREGSWTMVRSLTPLPDQPGTQDPGARA